MLPELIEFSRVAMEEKRKFRRVPMAAQIQGEAGDVPYAAEARNISVGGMLIRTSHTLREGQSIRLRFQLPGTVGKLSISGVVQHVSPEAYMGIRFTELSPEDFKRIKDYVDAAE
jgi:Tfp pilus assembly protein PilZ